MPRSPGKGEELGRDGANAGVTGTAPGPPGPPRPPPAPPGPVTPPPAPLPSGSRHPAPLLWQPRSAFPPRPPPPIRALPLLRRPIAGGPRRTCPRLLAVPSPRAPGGRAGQRGGRPMARGGSARLKPDWLRRGGGVGRAKMAASARCEARGFSARCVFAVGPGPAGGKVSQKHRVPEVGGVINKISAQCECSDVYKRQINSAGCAGSLHYQHTQTSNFLNI